MALFACGLNHRTAPVGIRELLAVEEDKLREILHDVQATGALSEAVVVSTRDGLLLRQEPDGSLVTHADLAGISSPPAGNELVVDARGNAYVNGGGFDLMAGEPFAPGIIALVTAAGSAHRVADELAFPNGMLVTGDKQRHEAPSFHSAADVS